MECRLSDAWGTRQVITNTNLFGKRHDDNDRDNDRSTPFLGDEPTPFDCGQLLHHHPTEPNQDAAYNIFDDNTRVCEVRTRA